MKILLYILSKIYCVLVFLWSKLYDNNISAQISIKKSAAATTAAAAAARFCGFRPPVDDVDTDASDVSLSREGTPNGLYT